MRTSRRFWVGAVTLCSVVLGGCATPAPTVEATTHGSTASAPPPTPAQPAPTTDVTTPPAATWSPAYAAAVAIAAHQPLDGLFTRISILAGQLKPCDVGEFGYDVASTRVVSSSDPFFTTTGVDGHLGKQSAVATAAFPDEASARAKVTPVLEAAGRCVKDTTEKDGTISHIVGSHVDGGSPFGTLTKIVTTGVYDTKKPQVTVELSGLVCATCSSAARGKGWMPPSPSSWPPGA